jgi:hypothetical protein
LPDFDILLYASGKFLFNSSFLLTRTWKSSKLADEMIQKLEEHGLQMAKQKQDYFGEPTLLSLWLLVYITCNTNGETETGLFW